MERVEDKDGIPSTARASRTKLDQLRIWICDAIPNKAISSVVVRSEIVNILVFEEEINPLEHQMVRKQVRNRTSEMLPKKVIAPLDRQSSNKEASAEPRSRLQRD